MAAGSADDLVDQLSICTAPVVPGGGKKLFADGVRPAALRLINTKTTGSGVIIATYEPAGPVRYGNYAVDQP